MQYVLPLVLSAIAVATVAIGLPLSKRFRHPRRFAAGVIAVALGTVLVWLIQVIVVLTVERSEYRWTLQVAGFVFPVFLIGGGLDTMTRANNSPRDDHWDGLFC